jgi:hypothetical protein
VNRSDVLQAGVIEVLTLFAQGYDRLFEIDGIPENDRSGDEIQAARSVPLSLECPICIRLQTRFDIDLSRIEDDLTASAESCPPR